MTKKPDDFVHLHTHSDMSQLDGCGKISEYVKEAKARGNPAIAFTDHGTMRGYMSQYEECKDLGVKPIYGLEFYVSPDMRRKGLTDEEKADITKGLKKSEQKPAIKEYEDREGIRDRWHLNVWAQNMEGMRNLYKLSSAAFIDGFYYKPRIDINELIKYGDGLVVSTGCLSSPINDCYIAGKKRYAIDFADKLHDAFGERMFLEIQPHAIDIQRTANRLMMKLRKRYGGKNRLLATQDAHYVNQEDAEHHEVLLCVGTADKLSNPDRFKFDGDEFHMRTRKQMWAAFRRHHEFIPPKLVKAALNATMEFAESVDVNLEVDYHKALLPDPGIPSKYKGDHFAYLKDLCLDGWMWREVPRRAAEYSAKHGIPEPEALLLYKERLIHEMKALKRQRFVPYFLIIHDLYRWARGEHIMVGPGRGSVAGCLIGYLIGITAVDPIEHGLIFERFINPNRIDMPDCDMDFEDRRRSEVIEYIRTKYGEDKVCQIATIGKMSGKQCVAEGSMIMMADGNTKPIEDVEPGELVVCVDEDGFQTESKVVAAIDNGEREVYDVLGEDGENLQLTGDHEVLTDRGWVRVDALRVSDNVIDLAQCLKSDATSANKKNNLSRPKSGRLEKAQGCFSAPGRTIGNGDGAKEENILCKSSKR